MNKKVRQKIFDKFGGKCAYCGCELTKGWHVDEINPCRRKFKTIRAHYEKDGIPLTSKQVYEMNLNEDETIKQLKWVEEKTVLDGYYNPNNLHINNQNPACASCNINKHSMSLEDFRKQIAGFMKHLNEINTQYKIAKRYGLIQETNIEVKFYFETLGT